MGEDLDNGFKRGPSNRIILTEPSIERLVEENPGSSVLELRGDVHVTSELTAKVAKRRLYGPFGWLAIAYCDSGKERAEDTAKLISKYFSEARSSITEVPVIRGAFEGGRVTRWFPDGEIATRLDSHVGGADVMLFADVHNRRNGKSTMENYAELLMTIWNLKNSGRAQRVTVVTPYCPFSRGHHRSTMKREAVTEAAYVASIAAMGADCTIFFEHHSEDNVGLFELAGVSPIAINGFDIPMNLWWEYRGADHILGISPDRGAYSKAQTQYGSEGLDWDILAMDKKRNQSKDDSLEVLTVTNIEALEGKRIGAIRDDEGVSGSTSREVIKAVRKAQRENGLPYFDEWWIWNTHRKILPQYEDAHYRFARKLGITRDCSLDTIPQRDRVRNWPFTEGYSCAEILARVIPRLNAEFSTSATAWPKLPPGTLPLVRSY